MGAKRHAMAMQSNSAAANTPERSRFSHVLPARTAAGNSSGVSAFIAHARIEPPVQNVGETASRDDDHAAEEYGGGQQRMVATANRVDDDESHAGPGKDFLHEYRAGEKSGKRNAQQGDHRQQGVSHSVAT